MPRRLLNLLTAISLLLSLAIAALWTRSYFRSDWIGISTGPTNHELTSYNGRLIYLYCHGLPTTPGLQFDFSPGVPTGVLDIERRSKNHLLGFTIPDGPITGPDADWWPFACPFWPMLLATAFTPTIRFIAYRRLPKTGHCKSCHYNLTGNTSGVCPECGTPIETKS